MELVETILDNGRQLLKFEVIFIGQDWEKKLKIGVSIARDVHRAGIKLEASDTSLFTPWRGGVMKQSLTIHCLFLHVYCVITSMSTTIAIIIIFCIGK